MDDTPLRRDGLDLGDSEDGDDGLNVEMPDVPRFFKVWFIFVFVLAMALLVGSVYVVYLLLDHFGVLIVGVGL